MKRRAMAAVVAGIILLTSCAGAGGAADPPASQTSPRSPSASSPSPARQLDPNGFPLPQRPDCAADAGGEFVRATTTDGNGVGILLLGTGASGVVLAPQSDGDICEWMAYALELAATYRVALFDWKERRSELPLLAATALRDAGVQDVVLGGASQGGALAMSQAHLLRPPPAGVLSFGGELTLPGFDGRPGIKKWHGPLLQISSRNDSFFDSRDAQRLRVLHPGRETVLMLPGDTHGVDLLDGAHRARVRATVDSFLARVLP